MKYDSLEDIIRDFGEKDCLTISNQNKKTIINQLKKLYLTTVAEIIEDLDSKNSELFYWVDNYVSFNLIKVSSTLIQNPIIYIYISPNEFDDIILKDITEETSPRHIKINSMGNPSNFLKMLINMDILENLSNCFPSTFSTIYSNDFILINSWIDAEYSEIAEELIQPLIKQTDFNQIRIHSDKYQFEKITSEINNAQLTFELSECLFAYDNQKWYICAAGIGAILEHLMHITLQNYNELRLLKSKAPTSYHYINAFRDSNHINFDMKKENYIKGLFNTRNSISHYYDGFTAKEQCESLLQGIKNIAFNDCIPSLTFVEPVQQ